MMARKLRQSSSMKGIASPTCRMTNLRRHFCEILRKVSHAMSCTPGCISCMNSKSLLTTVLRNFQCARRKRGYCPTTYMMLEATTALLSLPRFISHSPSRSLITVTRKRFSSSSDMAPEMEPIAQQSVLRLCHDHCDPSTWYLHARRARGGEALAQARRNGLGAAGRPCGVAIDEAGRTAAFRA